MRILVTGGLGFIGSNFCRHLIKTFPEYEIINIDKIGIETNQASLKDLENERRYKFLRGDTRDSKLLNNLITDVDAVVNMAAETHVDTSIVDPTSFLQNNTVGTFTILEAIRNHNDKAKLVHVSTDEVYGEIPEGSVAEEGTIKPSNPYSASKAAADFFVLAYCKTYDLNVTITRCTNNYGPYQFPDKLIPKTIVRVLKNLKVPVYGTGKNIRDWIYVQDHCEAVEHALIKGQSGEIYNISSGNEMSNIEIVRKILELLGKNEDMIVFVEDRPGHDVRYSLDSSKIRSKLSWKPRFSFKKALESTVNWYLNNEWWWKPLATRKILAPTPWKPE
jgi:dTDP-glucose 4,6-dehydratase